MPQVFVSKLPSVLPCFICASQCPPPSYNFLLILSNLDDDDNHHQYHRQHHLSLPIFLPSTCPNTSYTNLHDHLSRDVTPTWITSISPNLDSQPTDASIHHQNTATEEAAGARDVMLMRVAAGMYFIGFFMLLTNNYYMDTRLHLRTVRTMGVRDLDVSSPRHVYFCSFHFTAITETVTAVTQTTSTPTNELSGWRRSGTFTF
jgi:hypothetical protein